MVSTLNNTSGNVTSFTKRLLQAGVNLWESPFGSMGMAFIVYYVIIIYSGRFNSPSRFPYYNYLADAFLHGQFWFRLPPPETHDLVFFQGHYSLYQSPFPAFVILPLVALFGLDLNDVIYTAAFAVLNVGLLALLLRIAVRKEFIHLSKNFRGVLVMFLTLGTVHITLATNGRVWNTTLLLGLTFVLLTFLAAFSLEGWKAWFFTGLGLTAAMLTRNHLVFNGIFPIVYLMSREKTFERKRLVKYGIVGALPLVIGLGLLMFYNQIRFGNWFDNGLSYHLMADVFIQDFSIYGAFNLHYLPINLYYQYIFYPFPLRAETLMGGSLFLMSPLFFGALAAFWKPGMKLHISTLLFSILLTNIPILLLMGTGRIQFGPRYTLDFTVPLLLLTALGIEKWKPFIVIALTFVSILTFVFGSPCWRNI